MRLALLTTAIVVSLSTHGAAVDLPQLNFGANCAALQENQTVQESCMAEEERARARLANGWGQSARRPERVHPIVQHERLPELRGVAHLSADDAGRQEAAHAAMRSLV